MSAQTRTLLVDEGVLGHRTFAAILRDGLAAETGREPVTLTVPQPERPGRVFLRRPGALRNADLFDLRWRLRWSLQARGLLEGARAEADVALVNTQAAGLLAKGPMSKLPTVLSFDSTASQYMRLEYGSPRTWLSPVEETIIRRLEQRAISASAAALAWSEWTAAALRAEYDLTGVRLETLHPGLDADWWAEAAGGRDHEHEGPLRLLFVGNDVGRKGLDVLFAAVAALGDRVSLEVASGELFDAPAGVRVHRDLRAGTPDLRVLYARADIFAFPTRADVVPWSVLEAMAAGLPVVATSVGAIPEMLGHAGITIPAAEPARLIAAIDGLADPDRRRGLGERGLERVRRDYDRAVQMPRLARMLDEIAGRR